MLAPDLPLADVDAFVGGQQAHVLGVHKAGDEALGTVVVADHLRNHLQRLVDGGAIVFARVEHGREVAAGNEGDLVAILVVVGNQQLARFLILLALIDEGEPTDRPGHLAAGAAAGEGLAARADVGRGIVGRFVEAEVAGGRDLDLVDAHDGDVGDVPARERGRRSGSGERELCP